MHEVDKTCMQLQSADGHPDHTLLKTIKHETLRSGLQGGSRKHNEQQCYMSRYLLVSDACKQTMVRSLAEVRE